MSKFWLITLAFVAVIGVTMDVENDNPSLAFPGVLPAAEIEDKIAVIKTPTIEEVGV